MSRKPSGIQKQLRNSYAIFIAVLLVLVLSASYLINKVNELHKAQVVLLELESSFNSLKAEVNDLHVPDMVDDMLYSNPKQYTTDHFDPLKQEVEERSNWLRTNLELDSIDSDFQELVTLRQEYYQTVDSLILLSSIRGFKNFGLIGEMRVVAHFIEDSLTAVSDADILMLRRHEKDFLLRGENSYGVKFDKKVLEILQNTSEITSYDEQLLKRYDSLFKSLSKVDLAIGNASNPGLQSRLIEGTNQLSTAISSFRQRVHNRLEAQLFNIYIIFGLCVLIGVLLSIFLSFKLSTSIGTPVTKLASEIHRIELAQIRAGKKLKSRTTIKEVQYLMNSFNRLIEILSKQLELVDSKNTELLKSNKELEQNKALLEKSNSIKDKFFSIISHDLRGPIGGMKVYLEMLHDDIDDMDKEELKEFTEGMLNSATHLTNLMENLLEWSKSQMGLQHPKPVEISLKESVEHARLLYSDRLAAKELSFISTVAPGHRAIGDKSMVDFIIRNLISNAIKFTSQKGEIRVDTKLIDKEVITTVSDTGVGMSEDELKEINSFTQPITKRGTSNEKGTGLGLLMIQEFVKKNRGELLIESKEGVGTKVSFSLKSE